MQNSVSKLKPTKLNRKNTLKRRKLARKRRNIKIDGQIVSNFCYWFFSTLNPVQLNKKNSLKIFESAVQLTISKLLSNCLCISKVIELAIQKSWLSPKFSYMIQNNFMQLIHKKLWCNTEIWIKFDLKLLRRKQLWASSFSSKLNAGLY